MKKLVMTVAVLACAASMVSAQTVTSKNIVGYYKDVSPASSFHIAGLQFDVAATTPAGVVGDQLPVGSKIYKFTSSGYEIAEYIDTFDEFFNPITAWDTDSLDLGGSVGFWIENAAGTEEIATISGEVPLDGAITNSIVAGFQMLTYAYPVEVQVQNLGLTPTVGDKLYKFTSGGYAITEYIDSFDEFFNPIQVWDNPTLTLGVGEGFWYETTVSSAWIAVRPFTL